MKDWELVYLRNVVSPQDRAKVSGRFGIHAVSEFASDLTPSYLEAHGFKCVPQSVAYGYTASGYGFVQDMPYAFVHEFTRTSMAGKIRRLKGGYTSLWQKIRESLPVEILCNTEVLAVRRNSVNVTVNAKDINGETKIFYFDKIIFTGAFPFNNRKTYLAAPSNSTGLSCLATRDFSFFLFISFISSSAVSNWAFLLQTTVKLG